MWASGVIIVSLVAAAVVRYLRWRDEAPPMERHFRALEVLRDLSEHPHPVADLVTQVESSTGHVRIVGEAPPASRARLRATARATGPRPAGKSRRPARAAGTGAARSRAARRPPSPPDLFAPCIPPAPKIPAPEIRAAEITPRRTDPIPMHVRAGVGATAVALATVGIVVGSGYADRASARVTATPPRSADARPVVAPTAPPGTAPPATAPPATAPPTVPGVVTPLVTDTPSGATVTVPGPFRLTLRATGTCWVEITDAAAKTLLSTTMHAGQQQELPGVQAILVRLGYTPAMTIAVDGAAIDLGRLAQTTAVDFRTT